MKTLNLPSGRQIPILGQGTWGMGESTTKRKVEIDALRLGLDLGMTLIDTAEMYGEGGAEEVIAEAIEGRRSEVYLVSKVYPHNASIRGVPEACERSLRRLKTDYLDLYLLHWRGHIPLHETLEAFLLLKQQGKILDFGVSNFDLDDMLEAHTLYGGKEIATNQVLYNLAHRGIELDLLPWSCQNDIPIMAYSPIEQGGMLKHPALKLIASRHGAATPVQIALAWLIQQEVVVIPKSSNASHIRENRGALDYILTDQDLRELDQAFPQPRRKTPLEVR